MSLVASTRTALPDRDRARMVDLQDKVDELQERIRQLEDVLAPRIDLPPEWKLTRCEAEVFRALLGRDLATHAQLDMAACLKREETDNPRSGKVHICTMRRKLNRFGILIQLEWGVGYRLVDRLAWKARFAKIARLKAAQDAL